MPTIGKVVLLLLGGLVLGFLCYTVAVETYWISSVLLFQKLKQNGWSLYTIGSCPYCHLQQAILMSVGEDILPITQCDSPDNASESVCHQLAAIKAGFPAWVQLDSKTKQIKNIKVGFHSLRQLRTFLPPP